jgi:hypothetical protein
MGIIERTQKRIDNGFDRQVYLKKWSELSFSEKMCEIEKQESIELQHFYKLLESINFLEEAEKTSEADKKYIYISRAKQLIKFFLKEME